jgi:hypothetical protein
MPQCLVFADSSFIWERKLAIESLSFALYTANGKRQTTGKEKFYGIMQ